MWILLDLACTTDEDAIELRASLAEPPDPAVVAAARELTVDTTVPTTLVVTLDDGLKTRRITFPEAATRRTVPIVGFTPGAPSTLTAEVFAENGVHASKAWEVVIPSLPLSFPQIDVLAWDRDRLEPGWTLLDAKQPEGEAIYLILLDEAAQPIWWYVGFGAFGDARLLPNGHLFVLAAGNAWELDLMGRVVRGWGEADADIPTQMVPIPAPRLNHEGYPDETGFYSLNWQRTEVPAFPTSYTELDTFSTEIVADQAIVRYDWDGTQTLDLSIAGILDTQRIGFDSLDRNGAAWDWCHANGVVPVDNGLVVSVRHQDVVMKLDASGTLQWLLGTPSGWRSPWSDTLLTPTGSPFAWPFHAHAPEVEEDGTLVLFDNQLHGYTPYDEGIAPSPARVVGYRVDEAARTVSQRFSFSDTTTGTLTSDALGDADMQPLTGNLLADYGFVSAEGGVDNKDLGFATKSIRVVEYAPDGEVLADLRLHGDAGDPLEGWKSYRAERLIPWPAAGPEHAVLEE